MKQSSNNSAHIEGNISKISVKEKIVLMTVATMRYNAKAEDGKKYETTFHDVKIWPKDEKERARYQEIEAKMAENKENKIEIDGKKAYKDGYKPQTFSVIVDGPVTQNSYEDKEGNKKVNFLIHASEVKEIPTEQVGKNNDKEDSKSPRNHYELKGNLSRIRIEGEPGRRVLHADVRTTYYAPGEAENPKYTLTSKDGSFKYHREFTHIPVTVFENRKNVEFDKLTEDTFLQVTGRGMVESYRDKNGIYRQGFSVNASSTKVLTKDEANEIKAEQAEAAAEVKKTQPKRKGITRA